MKNFIEYGVFISILFVIQICAAILSIVSAIAGDIHTSIICLFVIAFGLIFQVILVFIWLGKNRL
ncbi:MAG: hypothetical protein AB7E61_06285 [Acholeplasmataceae bacterium]